MNRHTWLQRNDKFADDEWSLPDLKQGDVRIFDGRRWVITDVHHRSTEFEQTVTVETKIGLKGSKRRNPSALKTGPSRA